MKSPFFSSLRATRTLRFVSAASVAMLLGAVGVGRLTTARAASVEALLYSSMPSMADHRPEMAMDGDPRSYFKTVYGMGDGDEFRVLLSAPVPVRSLRVETGSENGRDALTEGSLEVSPDGVNFHAIAPFDASGVAQTRFSERPVQALRIKLNPHREARSLVIREIRIDSTVPISHVALGPGRGFIDLSAAPDVAEWARRAEQEMEQFWPEADAILYSEGFIPPNMVNIVYKPGNGVAGTGGGVMEVNADWCRKHPEDTGLTVHEMAHVVQSTSAYDPVWLIEGTADYIRWIKFEPENYKPRINPATATYHDSYRTTGLFLAWCELHYDSKLVTKLNDATRFGHFSIDLFQKFCGKDVDTLWHEFVSDYQANPNAILPPPRMIRQGAFGAPPFGGNPPPVVGVDPSRAMPTIGTFSHQTQIDLSAAFDTDGLRKDSTKIAPGDTGLDSLGYTYSSKLLIGMQTINNANFRIGKAGEKNTVSCRGNVIPLPVGKRSSLWLLGSAVQGNQVAQQLVVTYTDGTTETLTQSFSDWSAPGGFPGELLGPPMTYRVGSNGLGDHHSFYIYGYGFPLDRRKTVQSLTLPNNPNVKILGVTLVD